MRTQSGKSKVVVMCRTSNPENSLKITQRDLAEERLLKLQAAEAFRAWQEKRVAIRRALESGAQLEPGLRTAELRSLRRMVIR